MLSETDRVLAKLARTQVLTLAGCGVGIVGMADYFTGYELSFGIFYFAPIALAAWYADRRAGVSIAMLACLAWLLADAGTVNYYSHPTILIWNALVRFGYFLSIALLLAKLRAKLAAEQQLARTDPLTGIMNSRAFAEQLEYHLALARREGNSITLAYVDLDDFKRINDTTGHNEGDRVLCDVARVLSENTRRTDLVARIGGDEFVLLLPATDLGGAEKLISNLKQRLDRSISCDNSKVTCSIGVVGFREPPSTAKEAIRASDILMYEVKRRGKNAVAFGIFDPISGVLAPRSSGHAQPGVL